MKYRLLAIMGVWIWAASAHADNAGAALAQRSVCMACHQVDVKRVGPSFRDIALRYSENEAAPAYLARSIREGSRGLWGAIPMPAQRHVDPATALLLGEWIMSLAPATEGMSEEIEEGEQALGQNEQQAPGHKESIDMPSPESGDGL